jgi:hypothetical protein
VLLTLAIVVAVRAVRGPETEEKHPTPAVIFVVLDAVRADRTSLCGYAHPTTPTLDGLVKLGASHACNSHSPSTWTLPSHASFFTGRGLDEHQADAGGDNRLMTWGSVNPLDDRWPTLAEEMSARGYQTLLVSGNPVIRDSMGLTRGFEHAVSADSYPEMHDHRLAARLDQALKNPALDPNRPLFAFINIADAHEPWREIPSGVGFLPARDALYADPGRQRYETGAMDEEEAAQWLDHLSDVYDFGVLRADRSLRFVLERLHAEGWLDGGYRLVVTSDHGEYLGEHQMVEHGRAHFYEPVTRVPLLFLSTEGHVDLPEDVPAMVVHSLVRDGVLPERLPPKRASVFRSASEPPNPAPPCWYSATGLWLGRSKLVASRGEVLQFDLSADPLEDRPVAADDHPDAAGLLQHCRVLDHAFAARVSPNAEVTAEITAQLQALGYLREEDHPLPSSP